MSDKAKAGCCSLCYKPLSPYSRWALVYHWVCDDQCDARLTVTFFLFLIFYSNLLTCLVVTTVDIRFWRSAVEWRVLAVRRRQTTFPIPFPYPPRCRQFAVLDCRGHPIISPSLLSRNLYTRSFFSVVIVPRYIVLLTVLSRILSYQWNYTSIVNWTRSTVIAYTSSLFVTWTWWP